MPHFSGDIRYEWEMEVEEAGEYLLDLGEVGEAVQVRINGEDAGRRIMPPYVLDVSGYLKPGINRVEATVSNHSGFRRRDEFSRYLLFEPSGLLGPVKLKRKVK